MLLVALTGGIGSGKSVAGEFLESLGALVIDSDQLARQVVERGEPAFDEIVARFGDEVIKNGELDRTRLAQIVFGDQSARKDLEDITHPRIREAFAAFVSQAKAGDVVVNQIPLLVETGGRERFDFVITISAPLELRRQRCIERGMKAYEFDKRVESQASDEERAAISDVVIVNDGDPDQLLRALEDLWEETLIPTARSKA